MASAAEHSKEKMQSKILKNQSAGVTHWPDVNTRRSVLKRGQDCNKYTFGPRQRVTRNVEATLGDCAKSFPFVNKCTDFSIHAHKMSDQDIAQEVNSLQNSPQAQDSGEATSESSRLVRRWIASGHRARPSRSAEPVVLLEDIRLALPNAAGPSGDIERTAEPVVLLDDIRFAFPNVRYIC